MTALRVLRGGIQATVQDAGRAGYRALGVPCSGALDTESMTLANAVVGNAATTPVIEMLYSGIVLEVTGGPARVAVACADATVERSRGPSRALAAWRSIVLHAGDRLRVAAPSQTAAAYLAVEGGYDVPRQLGSASTYMQGRLGGYGGRALRSGDVLPLVSATPQMRSERVLPADFEVRQPAALRVMPGPQLDRFMAGALDVLLSSEYRVLPASNRSGLRMEGPLLQHARGHDLLSEGVATGSIQVPGSGQPVVLIGDHPTVGGYPRIAVVISADWPAAGRLRIGSTVRFAPADEAEAGAARRARREWIAESIASIEPVRDAGDR